MMWRGCTFINNLKFIKEVTKINFEFYGAEALPKLAKI
jgi:hypothetical protein